jgi:hypothetical protein
MDKWPYLIGIVCAGVFCLVPVWALTIKIIEVEAFQDIALGIECMILGVLCGLTIGGS